MQKKKQTAAKPVFSSTKDLEEDQVTGSTDGRVLGKTGSNVYGTDLLKTEAIKIEARPILASETEAIKTRSIKTCVRRTKTIIAEFTKTNCTKAESTNIKYWETESRKIINRALRLQAPVAKGSCSSLRYNNVDFVQSQ